MLRRQQFPCDHSFTHAFLYFFQIHSFVHPPIQEMFGDVLGWCMHLILGIKLGMPFIPGLQCGWGFKC